MRASGRRAWTCARTAAWRRPMRSKLPDMYRSCQAFYDRLPLLRIGAVKRGTTRDRRRPSEGPGRRDQAGVHARRRMVPPLRLSPDNGRGRAARVPSPLRRVGAGQGAAMLLVVGMGTTSRETSLSPRTARVTVIDPLPRWLVPLYKALCRFIVSMRLLGLRVPHTVTRSVPPSSSATNPSSCAATSATTPRRSQACAPTSYSSARQVGDCGKCRCMRGPAAGSIATSTGKRPACSCCDQLSGPSSHSVSGRLR